MPRNTRRPTTGAPKSGAGRLIDGRYHVLDTIGAGTMGVVYRAEDVFLQRVVAIKVIDPYQAKDAGAIGRFLKEARALAQIRHPNVVQVHALGPHEESFYFAMEYVAGQTLDAVIEEHAAAKTHFDFERATAIVRAVGSGLAAVHARKLVHRDVKPSNVMLEAETGRPVLIDFGLARRKSASNPKLSIAGGTPSYMAPEQARDPDGTSVTSRADIYALACSTFELLTGRPVFTAQNVFQMLIAHGKEPPPRISTLRPELAPLDDVLVRALSKQPEHRHATCEEYVADFDVAARAIAQQGAAERVLVLESDVTLRKRLESVLTRVLRDARRPASILNVGTADDLVTAFANAPAGLVVLDDESSQAPIADVVARVRSLPSGMNARFLVISRAWHERRAALAPLGVKEVVPKPLNPQMLGSVLERLVGAAR